jgi:hypothetical protein
LPKIAAVGNMKKFLFLILFISAVGFLFCFSVQETLAATVTLKPNANYLISCSRTGCTANYQCVADNSDSTYVYKSGDFFQVEEFYELEDSTNLGTINNVTIYGRFKSTQTYSYAGLAFCTNSSNCNSNVIFMISNSFQTYSKSFSSFKSGTSWTWDLLNSIKARIILSEESDETIYCSEVYVVVDYTPSAPPIDTTPPTFSNYNANTTVAGAPVNFSTVITDNVAMSGYIFETNNTGRWVNRTWTQLSSGGTAYNITRLNSTVGAVVQWRFYANDTSNNWNSSAIYNLTTTGIVIQSQVASSSDDAYEDAYNNIVYPTSAQIRMKYYLTPEPDEDYEAGFRWVVTIPKDSTINTAYASFYIPSTSYDDASGIRLAFQKNGNPPSFSSGLISTRPLTSSMSVSWSNSLGTGWITTPSLAGSLQEVVNLYDVTALVLITHWNANSGNWELGVNSYDYDGAHTYAPKLYVDYTPPAPPPALPTVTTDIATINLSTNQATLNGTVTATGGENPDHRYIYWDTDASGEPYANYVDLGAGGTGGFSTTITLTPGITYYYQARAHNSAGDGKGNERGVVTYQASGFEQSFLTSILYPLCKPNDDFTGTCQNLALYGDLSYLNVKWNASYLNNVEREIGIECYLNCPNPGDNITKNCAAYENLTNYCSYKSLTGYGFCTIVKPGYLFKGQINNVTCSFYDPANPTVNYLPYPNRTFKPINFDVYSALNGSVTVGKPFALPVNVRNLGLFAGNFTSNTSALVKPQLISIENPIGLIENLKYNNIGEIYSKVTFLSAEKINFKVLVKSNIDPSTCSISADCSYLGSDAECIASKCWKRITVEINSGMSSLPEFNWTGLLQIIILSTVVVFFSKRKS